MTYDEKEALLVYLESRLLDFCATAEKSFHNDNIDWIYDAMYETLCDMENTLETQVDLSISPNAKKST